MKTLKTQRRLASQILNVGKSRVLFDPDRINDIKEALTKADIRDLISEGVIKKEQVKERKNFKKENGRRGIGKIKKYVIRRKREYVRKIRKLRRYLKAMLEKRAITKQEFYKLRKYSKDGHFKDRKHLEEFIREGKKGTGTLEKKEIKQEQKSKETQKTKKVKVKKEKNKEQ